MKENKLPEKIYLQLLEKNNEIYNHWYRSKLNKDFIEYIRSDVFFNLFTIKTFIIMGKELLKERVAELVMGFNNVCVGKAYYYESLLAAYTFIARVYADCPFTMEEIKEHASGSLEKTFHVIALLRGHTK